MEFLFKIVNMLVIPAWVLLLFFPNHFLTKKLVFSYTWHIILALFYTLFIVWGSIENIGGNGGMHSMEALRIGFENDKVLLGAWLHYLVFDLFVAVWIVKDVEQKNIDSHWLKAILFFTLMLGPIGFLLYKVYVYYKAN